MSPLIIDPRLSGASGDMLIAALLDMHSDAVKSNFCQLLQSNIRKIDPHFEIILQKINNGGIVGTQLHTKCSKVFSVSEIRQHIDQLGNNLSFSGPALLMARSAFDILVNAEIGVHGVTSDSDNPHLHELASTDTIFDIVGFFYLWNTLGFIQEEIILLPISVGGGTVEIAHGKVSVPAPATIEIIRKGNLYIQGGPIAKELLTPTGAALLASIQPESQTLFPRVVIKKIGRSFGTRRYGSNVTLYLQIISAFKQEILQGEEIAVLETNVDDVNGETLGYLFETLLKDSLVLDLSILPTITKKNRPGHLVRVIVDPSKIMQVTKVLSSELGTLGVRYLPGFRHIVARRQETHQIKIFDKDETVRVKIGYLGDEQISYKVEFEDLNRIAGKANISLQDARKRVIRELSRLKEENEISKTGNADE
ncbi:MAG: nickel pincer cofactor biosynthesis protein LarC [Candidatus Heimdallarchaeota archaeon]